MIGLASFPERTLVERAMSLMLEGPCGADRLAREVMGLRQAPLAVAERLSVAMLAADPRVRQLEDGRWALVAEVGGSPLLEDCAFAVVDVETTGSRATGPDRVMEVAVVLLQGSRREVVFDSLVNPRTPIPPRVAALTGISPRLVAGAPEFDGVADQVLAALAGRIFVAHNARFDWGFLTAEMRRTRGLGLTGSRICTVRLARRLLPQLESRSLDSLTYFFGLENPARHRAAGDAIVTAEVLERLLLLARERGARTLADLEALCRKKTVPGSTFRVPRGKRRKGKRRTRDSTNDNAELGTRNAES
jgi:DNA polymerase III subunit epsilon